MKNKKIPFAGPSITDLELQCTRDATINGFYDSNRAYVDALENIIKDVTLSPYCFATPCCTSAMYSSCLALDLKEGDEVICTDLSWASTSFVIDYVKAIPVFVDVDFDTWCISPEAIENAITNKTKAIMIVHMFGHPCDMDKIMKIANEHNLYVIEDAAPALGSTYKDQAVGTFGDFGCFSFHGAKLAVSGQGGAFIAKDKELFNKAELLSSTGRTDSGGTFWCDIVGHHHEIANICAAMAYAQICRLKELINIKHTIFSWYEKRLDSINGIKLIKQQEDCYSTYCYPALYLEDSISVSREYILSELKKLNIHGRPVFPRMSRFPMHEERFENPIASMVEKRGMNLPSAANITEEDVDFVCDSMIKIIGG